MWTTQDGHTLRLPPSGLATITPQLRRPGLWNLVMRNMAGNLQAAVAKSVGQMAQNAYRVGTYRFPSGRRYPIFVVQVGGRDYLLITRTMGDGQGMIVAIRPSPGPDLERPKQGRATVTYSPIMTLDQALPAGAGRVGMYVIMLKDGTPLTNGIAGKNGRDLRTRISEEWRIAERWGANRDDVRVQFAFMPKRTYTPTRGEVVEHALRRIYDEHLKSQGKPPLRGKRPEGKMMVLPGKSVRIRVRGGNNIPSFVRSRARKGRLYYGPGDHEVAYEILAI